MINIIFFLRILCKPLAHIFSLSLKLGIFPRLWKIIDVVALHKKKSKSDPSNYRPISLLSIMSKVLEHLINDKMKVFLGPKLNAHQFGFRRGHTTTDLLVNMSQSWVNALHDRQAQEGSAWLRPYHYGVNSAFIMWWVGFWSWTPTTWV